MVAGETADEKLARKAAKKAAKKEEKQTAKLHRPGPGAEVAPAANKVAELEIKRDKEKKDKKDKKDKTKKAKDKKEKVPAHNNGQAEAAPKKMARSKSRDAPKKRTSKWEKEEAFLIDSDDENDATGAMPAQRPEKTFFGDEDSLPVFSNAELVDRSIFVDSLALDVQGNDIVAFFNGAILAVTGHTLSNHQGRSPIYSCIMTEKKSGSNGACKVAELRFRTPEGASVCYLLKGIQYNGNALELRRPAKFIVDLDDEPGDINVQNVRISQLIGTTSEEMCLIFNLPDELTESVARDLLSQFGKLKTLKLVVDSQSAKIKGSGVFEYENMADTDLAIDALNGFPCGKNVIRCRKPLAATASDPKTVGPVTCTSHPDSITQKIIANKSMALEVKQGRVVGAAPTTVVQLLNAVTRAELTDVQEYDEILAEVQTDAAKSGKVTQVMIPRPASDGSHVPGLGKIFVAFEDLTSARKYQLEANGRRFDERVVCAAFYPLDLFREGTYNLPSARVVQAMNGPGED